MNKSIGHVLNKNLKSSKAFTIVELLVVIVVIGILAAITIVSYSGITNRAITASIKSQLNEDSKVLKMYYVDHGLYPSTLDSNYCPLTPEIDNRHCLRNMDGATLTYSGTNNSFTLTISKNNVSYDIIETGDIAQSTSSAAAKSFVVTWGGIGNDGSTSITQTSDGGYITAGGTDSYGVGAGDAFLAKYDQSGNLSWSKTWGGVDYENVNCAIQTNDGGYMITGYTYSYDVGGADAFLAKYDQSGNLSWSKTWGDARYDYAESIIQTSDSGYMIVGFMYLYGSDGGGDAFLAKYDQSGNLSWSKTWGGADEDYPTSIIQTSDEGYVLAGETKSYGAGGADAFLAKYDQSGNLSWSKTWGGADEDRVTSIIQTSDDNYVLAGHTKSYGAGGTDAFLAKYDQSGNLSWSKTWGGADEDFANTAIQTTNDDYAITGYTMSYGAGDGDAFLAKYKSDGTIRGCSALMCQIPNATETSPIAAVTNPSTVVSSPTAAVTSPSATVTSPMATSTVIVAPL